MFNFFKKKKEINKFEEKEEIILEEKEVITNNLNFFDDENCIKNMDLFLNKFFECEKIYTYVISKPPKTDKYYMQVVNSKLLGFVYTDKDKANKYLDDELKEIKKEGIYVKEMQIEDIMNYIQELKYNKVEGIIINYPYNWIIFNLKN